MTFTHTAALRVALVTLAALGAAAARPAAAQQTLTITLTAPLQNGTAPTPSGDVTMQASTANATVTLTAGVPQLVALGSMNASYGSFPNGTGVPFTFSFTRSLTGTIAGVSGSLALAEPVAGSGSALVGGSAGQYHTYYFSVSGAASSTSLGPLGTLQEQWQSGMGNSDGLSGTSAPLSAVLTFAAAPEPSQTAALALGALGLSVLALRARRRPA